MPLYEYRCVSCNASEERLNGFSSPAEHDCPVCGKTAGMRRQLSAPSIAFSGGGWYAQGYSDSPPCKAEEKPSKKKSTDTEKSKTTDTTTSAPTGCCGGCPLAE